MSSDRSGAVGEATPAAAAASTADAADGGLAQSVEDDAQADDPWFAPGPKIAASPEGADAYPASAEPDSDASIGADGYARQAEWFLRTGRAGLHPDSAPSLDEASAKPAEDDHEVRHTAAGAPPWAGETTAVSASTPPPWENGPWPGPHGLKSPGSSDVGDNAQTGNRARDSAATETDAASAVADNWDVNGAAAMGTPALWSARTVVTTGLIPLVVPGLVVGVLSLRQHGNQAVRRASWLAIGASVAWALIIILIVVGVSGGAAASCGSYPAAVHQAYEKAMSDLRSNAPASVQAADLESSATLANASAASAGQIGVRTALFSMANDMAQARSDVVAGRPIPVSLRHHLDGDAVVPAGSCSG
ncbi:MAG TPA: hypothetical protein VLM11_15085 [Streptosporangiaceae bacterium]|nr:hypothetical protein [Streptosporangiaceae bacterium]